MPIKFIDHCDLADYYTRCSPIAQLVEQVAVNGACKNYTLKNCSFHEKSWLKQWVNSEKAKPNNIWYANPEPSQMKP